LVVYPDDMIERSADGPIFPGQREPPPKDLTPKQQAIWRSIVADHDRQWFSESYALLTELVCHISYAREIATSIETVRQRLAAAPTGSKEEVTLSRQLASLMRQHAKQSSSIATLSTRLRLTPQSRQSARASDQIRRRTAPGRRPWEGWERGS